MSVDKKILQSTATNLLTTCKLSQAMRTHLDTGLSITSLLQNVNRLDLRKTDADLTLPKPNTNFLKRSFKNCDLECTS